MVLVVLAHKVVAAGQEVQTVLAQLAERMVAEHREILLVIWLV